MAHPCHYYVKFMILQGWPEEETVDTVNLTLRSFGLPEIADTEFEQIRLALEPPKSFNPMSKTHKVTVQYLKEEKVFSLWQGKKEDLAAVEIINLPQVRETIQLLLLGRFTQKEIRLRLQKKYKKSFTEQAISVFRHYFWNSDLMGLHDIRTLMFSHPMRDPFIASMYGSQNQALFRAGFNPQIDGRAALKEAHRSLAMRVEATRMMPDNKDTSRILSALTKELVSVHNALHGEGAGVEDMMKELQRFIMERNAPNVVPIHKLAPNNNFSHGGQKDSG